MLFAPLFFIFYRLSGYFTGKNDKAAFWILVILCVLLVFIEFTDFLDGFFARKLGEVSDLGKLYDPFADALLHITMFFCFARDGVMPQTAFVLIFWREYGQIFLRMISIKGGFAVAARKGGKLKTVVYIISGFYALALQILEKTSVWQLLPPFLNLLATVLFWVCAALSWISFIDYLILFHARIKK
jgi:CDP-diacylglycerol--glycerol-3-phosphate 3-phosphatidyltransferase